MVDSASNINEYQRYLLKEGSGKGGQWVGLTTLPPSYADCLEGWEPHPPGTLRACAGIVIYVRFFNLLSLFLLSSFNQI